uniref:Nose resistant to fluoxetine protein 6 n=1 Tax=Aceria tosichella TaxID=561515 RepID=A0A6G1SBC7_9ACAR
MTQEKNHTPQARTGPSTKRGGDQQHSIQAGRRVKVTKLMLDAAAHSTSSTSAPAKSLSSISRHMKMILRKPQASRARKQLSSTRGKTTTFNMSISQLFIPLLITTLILSSIEQLQTTTALLADDVSQSGGGPLWLAPTGKPRMSARLEELLERVGPNMRASADYRDFRDVKLNESLEGWRVLYEQASEYAHQEALGRKPKLIRLLKEANVSSGCLNAADETLDSMARLESWAVQMWSYSGNFPAAASFAGHFHDLGSYKGCIDIVRPATTNTNPITTPPEAATATSSDMRYSASYCTVGFRPIMPVRPRFHLIFKQAPQELVRLFNESNIMALMASQAQYFHYVYLKTGVCVPSECSSRDIQQVAKTIGRKLALMSAPVKCFTRAPKLANHWYNLTSGTNESTADSSLDENNLDELEHNKPVLVDLNERMNFAQLVSLSLIGAFFFVVFLATLWHAAELAWFELTTRRKFASSMDLSDEHYGRQQQQSAQDIKHQTLNCDSNNNNKHQLISMGQLGSSVGNHTQFVASPSLIQQGRSEQIRGRNDLINLDGSCFKTSLFYYCSMITNGREFCDTSMRSNEIRCLHGFRVGTMLWIICVHVLQYNDWSGFTRIFENVPSLQNPIIHPIINANYVVDNFFLMSGLLVAYTTWHSHRGASTNFNLLQSLLGRYLRLTPQVLLISLMYIVLPSIGFSGPFWYDMTHYAAKYCEKNWWVNLLHLQAFYREDEICNLVGWWISVDVLYYIVGLLLLWMILNKRIQLAYTCTCLIVGFSTLMTIWRHYSWGLSPNNLGLVPQVNEVWTEFVVKFFWSPYPHAYVFFLGLWLGYLMANKIGLNQVRRWSKLGWFLSLTSLAAINMSSRLWLIGVLELTTDQQVLSTSYNVICVIIWASSFGWMIVACHYGCAPLLNRLLSTKASIMLSKASFIIYLSHMLVLRTFYGTQYNLLEVSTSILIFLVVGITFVSVLFGVFLCVAFEAPCMKVQRLILNKIKSNHKLPPAGLSFAQNNNNNGSSINNNNVINQDATTSNEEKIILNSSATGVVLFK